MTMRIVFLVLLLASLGLTWLAWQQPDSGSNPPLASINLPRVSELALWSESPVDGVVKQAPPAALESSELHESPSADESGAQVANSVPPPPSAFSLSPGSEGARAKGSDALRSAKHDRPASVECFVISGFTTREGAERWLKAVIVHPTVRVGSRRVPVASLHWVLVPPLKTRAEGLRLLNQLQRRGVDSYLIKKPPQENAISLGLFKSRRAAESVLRLRRQEGLNAILAEYERSREEYYVAVLGPPEEQIIAGLEEKLSLNKQTEACRVLH